MLYDTQQSIIVKSGAIPVAYKMEKYRLWLTFIVIDENLCNLTSLVLVELLRNAKQVKYLYNIIQYDSVDGFCMYSWGRKINVLQCYIIRKQEWLALVAQTIKTDNMILFNTKLPRKINGKFKRTYYNILQFMQPQLACTRSVE